MSKGTYPETLIVGRDSSECGSCGKSCNPFSETHDVILGYGPQNGLPGCGVRWTRKTSHYIDMDISHFRPDLILV